MIDITTLTTPTQLDHDRFRAEIPDGYQQGRGAFGGLVLANLVRAIEASDAEPTRSLRNLSAEICGPVQPGSALIHVTRLRAGTGVSTIAASLEQGGEILAHAVGVRGRARGSDTDFRHLEAPPMPPWREVPVIAVAPPVGPVFARNFEFRVTSAPPYSGAREAFASGWIRPKDPGPARDAAYVTLCADAWWPAILARLSDVRPLATVAFTLELVSDLEGLDPEAPLFHAARCRVAKDGYALETRELWGEDGRLVAQNHQTFVVIK